jgi:hypothetical protein
VDSQITHENRQYKSSLFFLVSFHHDIWNNRLGKFNGQQEGMLTAKTKLFE